MKYNSAVLGVCLVLVGCATARMTHDGMSLIPPSGLSKEEKIQIIHECNSTAHKKYEANEELTKEQQVLISQRETKYFYRHGTPVVNDDYTPHQHITTIPPARGRAPNLLSDHYVVCFIEKGYSWPEPK